MATVSARRVFVLVYLIVVSVTLYALFWRWRYDDPFITYRYADNLARGLGFVYNPGERVLSTTTPLFALLLALLRSFTPDLAAIANATGAVSIAVGSVCLWSLGRGWRLPLVAWSGLLLYPTFVVLVITISSETPPYLALSLAAFAFYQRRRWIACAVCCASATLMRGDGVLVAFVIASDFVVRVWRVHRGDTIRSLASNSALWRAVAVFAVITLTWFAFATLYFGAPLPATLAAKQHQGGMAVSQLFAPGLLSTVVQWYGGLLQHRIEAALAAVGLIYGVLRRSGALIIVAWAVVYFIAYAVLGVSSYFWYYTPLVPGFIVLVSLGLTALAEGVTQLSNRLQLGWLLSGGVLMTLTTMQLAHAPVLANQPDSRYAIYRAAGEWLRNATQPSDSVGTLEVGIIGYFAQRPMIDFAGLIQPAVAQRLTREATYDDAALYAVERYQPDYVVVLEGGLPRLTREYVQPQCDLKERLLGQKYEFSADLLIYRCNR